MLSPYESVESTKGKFTKPISFDLELFLKCFLGGLNPVKIEALSRFVYV
jgi:hypothetical protein